MLKLVERFMPAEYAGDSRMFEQTLAEFRAYYGEHKEDHRPYAGQSRCSTPAPRACSCRSLTRTTSRRLRLSSSILVPSALRWCRRIDAFPPKPEAPVTLHVMEELGADPATTLYVGDSNVDVLTGHNAGLKSAGVSWGSCGRAELEAAGADYVVDTGQSSRRWCWASSERHCLTQLRQFFRAESASRFGLRMGCAFRLRRIQGNRIPVLRVIFRVALSATHPIRKNATHYSAKTGSRFSQALDATWHKECPNYRQKRNVPKCCLGSFKNVPND